MAPDGTNVVAFFASEGLYCYDMDGHLRWQKDLGLLRASPTVYNDAPAPKMSDFDWGFASSPIIHGNRVFLQCDVVPSGFVAPFEIADRKEICRTKLDNTGPLTTPT